MFGFLKKKLKDAVSKFSKKAEEEIVEENVEDTATIEEAKQEEKQLLKKAKKVEVIPETPKEKEQHEKEKPAKKVSKKPAPRKKPAKVEVIPETAEEKAQHEKPAKKPAKPAKKETKPSPKEPAPIESEPVTPAPAEEPEPEEQEPAEEPILEDESTPKPEKKGFFKGIFGKKKAETPTKKLAPAVPEPETPAELEVEEPVEEPAPDAEEPVPEIAEPAEPEEEPEVETEPEPESDPTPEPEVPKKRGIFGRLKESFTKKSLSEEKFEELFWDLEVVLLENNVALEVIEKLKTDMKEELTTGKVSRLGVDDMILLSLKRSIEEVLDIKGFDLVEKVKTSKERPYKICFIGVNGSGKTTTLAKVANMFQEEGLSVVMAASDTFRAAAIDQLKEHADKLSIKLISQGYGADPAAVAFDAIEHAKAKQLDVVMIDTAGRLHSNTNLMAELEKVVRVSKPDLKIFIGESVTGNDCVEQAKEFDKAVGIDAIILSKADVDEKGGAALSVSYVTGKPILYLGVGQAYGDLKEFDKNEMVKSLGL